MQKSDNSANLFNQACYGLIHSKTNTNETYLSAQSPKAPQQTRVSFKNGRQGWPQCAGKTPPERAQESLGE